MSLSSQSTQPIAIDSAVSTGLPFSINRRLLVALALALVYHGSLLLSGSYKGTYDAYVHIFFADHYRRFWFDHWDTRWYTGFTLTSYPPGSQQSIALIAGLFGLQGGFIVVQSCSILWTVMGVYRFSKIWVSEEAAGNAALLAVFASSITETVHVFGQLPTMFSLGFLLNALPFVYRWMRTGNIRILLVAWSLNAATTAGHHVSTLFGAVFFVAPVILLALVESLRDALADEPPGHPPQVTRANLRPLLIRRLRRIMPSMIRAGVYGVGLIAALILVVLPYWLWSKADPITQVSIPHSSRDSFIVNTSAGLVFWLIPYGLSLVAVPYVYVKGFGTRAWPLMGSIAVLMLLGTGGTTPIPKLLLGGAFDVLTLDRFTFWATIAMLPLLGAFVVSLRHGRIARLIREQLGRRPLYAIQIVLVLAYLLISAFVANLTQFRKFQPQPIDMQPIVTFLEKDQHYRWRYLPLGFGDQMAWLSAQTTATTVDGNYHSARRLPELTTTPVERLEGAKFRGLPGLGSLQQFLGVPEKYNLKFVLSNDQFYDPLLFFSGWHQLQRLENGIVVWEREGIPPLPDVLPRREIPLWQRVMWGTVPISMLVLSMVMVSLSLALDIRHMRHQHQIPSSALDPPSKASRFMAVFNPLRFALAAWRGIDRWLLRWSELPEYDNSPVVIWQPWIAWLRRIRASAPLPASFNRRLFRSAVLLLMAISIGGLAVHSYLNAGRDPKSVIEQYYDDLDFRRFANAYARLDPRMRPSYDQYLLERSVGGGLVASYGKLDSVRVQILAANAEQVRAQVTTIYVTALSTYTTIQIHDLTFLDGNWYIKPDPSDPTIPPDTFFRQGAVAWHAQGRRRVSTTATDVGDILDQPDVRVLSARLVRTNARYQVVGELMNTDIDPADITLTAALFDAQNDELTRYDAQTGIIHKLFPKEITPFRVDFEGVAGSVLSDTLKVGDFQPGDFTPPNLLHPVTSFVLQPLAVVTSHDLVRNLAIQDIQVVRGSDGDFRLIGRLLNIGTIEATIPHVFITLYDASGSVAWVQDVFVEQSIRPQRSVPFSITIRPASKIETVATDGGRYAGELDDLGVRPDEADRLELPPETGYAFLRVTVHSYLGGGG